LSESVDVLALFPIDFSSNAADDLTVFSAMPSTY